MDSIFDKSFRQFKNNISQIILLRVTYIIIYTLIMMMMFVKIPGVNYVVNVVLNIILLPLLWSLYNKKMIQVAQDKKIKTIKEILKENKLMIFKFYLLTLIKSIMLIVVSVIAVIFINEQKINLDSTISNVRYFYKLAIGCLKIIVVTKFFSILIEYTMGFVNFLVIDEDFSKMSLKEILINGIKMMKGYRIRFFLGKIICWFLNSIGFMIFGVGKILTAPYGRLLIINLYQEAKENYFKNDKNCENN